MLDRMLLAAGGDEKLYVEDVFSTYLYTGNGSTQTITNGIDLAGKGGWVWIKDRTAANNHISSDTVTSSSFARYQLFPNQTNVIQGPNVDASGSWLSNGFSFTSSNGKYNVSGDAYTSWTFRKAPKFFDVVTYTGNGVSGRQIAHSLGVAPGCIIVKRTDAASDWAVYHRGNTSAAYYEKLNLTDAQTSDSTVWNSTAPTDSVFSVGTSALTNANGGTYVAYVFAHDTSSTGLIQCGSYTGSGNNTLNQQTLGWEPQWLMVANVSTANDFYPSIIDNMRQMTADGVNNFLYANLSNAENANQSGEIRPNATGFSPYSSTFNNAGATYIYIAIRRGPMKTPTSGTSVFSPIARTGTGTTIYTTTSGFAPDSVWMDCRSDSGKGPGVFDRLRGVSKLLQTTNTNAEVTNSGYISQMTNTGYTSNGDTYYNTTGITFVDWCFRRAPSFFDVVAYTGNGVNNRNIPHNLGAVPEMVIYKSRSLATDWNTYVSYIGATNRLQLNTDTFKVANGYGWNNTDPTATNLILGGSGYGTNNNGATYVAYLFASCPGVSKVGSYTGNGSSQTINCGFSSGARFFLVKRTDSTGDWWVYDSARGIVAAADPALSLNSTAAEVTSADAVDTNSTGIIVNQEATCNINVNSATYIYLAIA